MSAFELPERFFEDREFAINVLLDCDTISRTPDDYLVTSVYGSNFYFDPSYFVDLIWSMRKEPELLKKYIILAKLDFPFVSLFY